MDKYEIKNAIITSTSLGFRDHGYLSARLNLDYGAGSGQSFCGYAIYLPPDFSHHKIESVAGHFIYRCCEIAGVKEWDRLVGMAIRVKANSVRVIAIGHIIKNDWFNPAKDFERKTEIQNG